MGKDTTEKKAAPLTEEQLLERDAILKAAEQKLSEGEAKLAEDIKEFENFQETVFQEKEKLAAEREAFTKEKALFEEKVKNSSTEAKPKEAKEPVKCTLDDEEYQFNEDAPELILFNGKGWTHQEIAEDKDVLLQIIGGGLGLITKI